MGGDGNDTIFGQDDEDTLEGGGVGNDVLMVVSTTTRSLVARVTMS